MSRLTYADVATKPMAFVALTSLTVEEFQALLPAFEDAFQAQMARWTLEGKLRQNRRYTPYANSPLPTPAKRLLFILSYLKQNPTQAYHGQLFALPQGQSVGAYPVSGLAGHAAGHRRCPQSHLCGPRGTVGDGQHGPPRLG